MKQQTEKKKYVSPIIEEVELAPEEAVLQGCKTDSGGAFGKTNGKCSNNWMCNDAAS